MTLFRKLTLLLAYLSLLFLLARLLEVLSGQVFRWPLDPASLPVAKLKTVLEWRGVDYEGLFEKSEVQQLVEESGGITQEELDFVTAAVNTDFSLTNYSDFNELHARIAERSCGASCNVEDAKENMWLVEIVSKAQNLLSDSSWEVVRSKVGKFGVRFGRFYCRLNEWACKKNNWHDSRLVLFLPSGNPSRYSEATIHTHTGSIKLKSLFNWIKRKVNTHVQPIKDLKTFHSRWQTFDSQLTPEVRVVFVSPMSDVPMFLSALRVKFPGRVKIGSIDTKFRKGKEIVKEAGLSTTSAYMVLTPEVIYQYGSRRGEMFTFRAMEIFIKSFYPMFSDLFVMSVVLTNIALLLDVAMLNGIIEERVGIFFFNALKYNGIVLTTWIVFAILPSPFYSFCRILLKLLRPWAATLLFSLIRIDCMYHIDHPTQSLVTVATMVATVAFVRHRFYPEPLKEGRGISAGGQIRTLRQGGVYNSNNGTYASGGDISSPPYRRHRHENMQDIYDYDSSTNDEEDEEQSSSEDDNRANPRIPGPGPPQQNVFTSDLGGNRIQITLYNGGRVYMQLIPAAPVAPPPTAYIPHLPCWHYSNARVTRGNRLVCSSCNHDEITFDMRATKPEGYHVDSECVICQEDYKHMDLLRGVPCGHVFHAECIWQWLSRGGPSCPNCRARTN